MTGSKYFTQYELSMVFNHDLVIGDTYIDDVRVALDNAIAADVLGIGDYVANPEYVATDEEVDATIIAVEENVEDDDDIPSRDVVEGILNAAIALGYIDDIYEGDNEDVALPAYLSEIEDEREYARDEYGYDAEHDAGHNAADFLLFVRKYVNRGLDEAASHGEEAEDGMHDALVKVGGLVHSYLQSR